MRGAPQQAEGPALGVGPVTLRPSGFFHYISTYRTADGGRSVATQFGAIPLGPSDPQWRCSPAHSRTALSAELLAGGRWLGYYESDFLNGQGGSPYRLRQLWGQFERGSWKILAGQGWSLLRPNRRGISSQNDLMNTTVVEPSYHVGLAGMRKRQIRVTRSLGAWQAALAYEDRRGGDVTAKVVRDGERAHWEAVVLAGHGRRFGAGLAAVVRAAPKLSWVSQAIWSQGLGPDLVGSLPPRVHAHAMIQGVEAKLTGRLEAFAYGGWAYATRSPGNRALRQLSVGLHRKLFVHPTYGSTLLSLQYSRLDRAVWAGGHGRMNSVMLTLRHILPPPH